MAASPKFFAGVLIGLLLALGLNLLAFGLVLGVPTDSSRWTFEVNRKKQELAAAIPPPRLLLVGGSSVLFGISARDIEQETGIRTVNMGTYAALGMRYILTQTRKAARPGDTVLLVFEYKLYGHDRIRFTGVDSVWLDYLVARDPAYFHQASLFEQWNTFMLTPTSRIKIALKTRFNPGRYQQGTNADAGVYTVANINAWGDQTHQVRAVAHLDSNSFDTRQILPKFGKSPAGFPVLMEFCHWAATNHIRVLASYPNAMDGLWSRTPEAKEVAGRIANFYSQLGVPVVGEYTDAILPPDQFFDTVYHLQEPAVLARTQRLVEKLRPWLNNITASH